MRSILLLGSAVLALACGAALVLACSSDGASNPPPAEVTTSLRNQPGNVVSEDVVTMSAVVEAIDHDTRMVTLRDADGERVTFRVGEAARNLSQVQKGDLVDATYYQSVAIQLRRQGEATPGVSAAAGVERAEPGEAPGAAGAQSVTVVATIRALDREARTATLEGPDGGLTTINVRNPAHFDVAKVGDLVEITYTEAIAIAVEKKGR